MYSSVTMFSFPLWHTPLWYRWIPFLFHGKFNCLWLSQCALFMWITCPKPLELSHPCSACSSVCSETLLISLFYDRDGPCLEASHKLPPRCCCWAGQLWNKPHSTLLASLHMTDATNSPLPLLSQTRIDSSPPRIDLDTIIQQPGKLE